MVTYRYWIFLALLVIQCLPPSGYGTSYFIKLTPAGMEARSGLLAPVSGTPPLGKYTQSPYRYFPIAETRPAEESFSDWLILEADTNSDSLIQQLKSEGIIDYAEPVGFFKIKQDAPDSLVATQWYLDMIDVAGAWNVSRGMPDIILGVIDTGIDYTHPDLSRCLWINAAEDLNGNGIADAGDLNGIDDDGNGFVDDVMGWDFTDAPRFADGGDYETPDNDPMDEYQSGHGTQIAGIIAGGNEEGSGIRGIAPSVKVMNLRAGTASGYLEEDDVARALLYAIGNGARIINMSFGDVALSRFLKDVIHYAYEQGAIIIASAGNEATDLIHYPSGLPEVVSVGASNQSDNRAGFSNFGTTLDMVAPGSNIFSTAIGGGYNTINGTSFSAPMVSACAALLLSVDPFLEAEQVRNILKTSSEDILIKGWDHWSGAGRLSAGRAMHVDKSGILYLSQPTSGFSVSADFLWITGSVSHPDLKSYELWYGLGSNPADWQPLLSEAGRQVYQDTLALLDLTTLPDTVLTLRLRLNLINRASDEMRVTFEVDRTEPLITNVSVLPLLDGHLSASLISFETDDITSAGIYLRREGEPAFTKYIASGYETRRHFIKTDMDAFEGHYDFYVEVRNAAGLSVSDRNSGLYYSFENRDPMRWKQFFRVPWSLPSGYMLPEVTDLDHDSKKEIIISRYSENHGFGPVEIYEFEGGRFELRLETAFPAIPRAAGDVDGDGLSDILFGYGQQAFILESTAPNTFPTEVAWADSLQFWGAAYTDMDHDGQSEIIGRIDSQYVVLENSGDNRFSEITRLDNPSEGSNRFAVPRVAVGDLNGDAHSDLAFGDTDGDYVVYTAMSNNRFSVLTSGKAGQKDVTEMIVMDRRGHMFTGSHTAENVNYEHEYDARYWLLEGLVFTDTGSPPYVRSATAIYGYQSTREYDSGLKLAEWNGREALFVSFFPDLYVFMKEEEEWMPVWHYREARSNTVITADLDNDGQEEFYFNDGREIIGYSSGNTSRPEMIQQISAVPLDSARVHIRWTGNSPDYGVYRGIHPDSMRRVAQVDNADYTDSLLIPETLYYYTVTAVDSGFEYPESFPGKLDSARTSYPPMLIDTEVVNEKQLALHFNEDVIVRSPLVRRLSDRTQATSVVSKERPDQVLVSFASPFVPGRTDTVFADGITDRHRVPVDIRHNRMPFVFRDKESEPYVEEVQIRQRFQLHVRFSEPMDSLTLKDLDHYSLEPSGEVLAVSLMDRSAEQIMLKIDEKSFAGGFGQPAYLVLSGLKSAKGVAMRNGGTIHLYEETGDLARMLVYPQPLKPDHRELVFSRIPDESEISIFNLNGRLIRKLSERTFFGAVRWDLRDTSGNRIPSGIYVYEIRHEGEKKVGKLVVLR